MFPIYEAITFENITLEGGSTRPLVFLVDTKNSYKQFVVKVFSGKDREQYNPTAKECYAHVLAEEFSLQQPEAAIIKFDEDFLDTIPEETANRINDSGSLFHYGTELQS